MRKGAWWTTARHRRQHTAGRDRSKSRNNVWRVSGVKKRCSQGKASMERVSAPRARMSADRRGIRVEEHRARKNIHVPGVSHRKGKRDDSLEAAPAASRTMAQRSGPADGGGYIDYLSAWRVYRGHPPRQHCGTCLAVQHLGIGWIVLWTWLPYRNTYAMRMPGASTPLCEIPPAARIHAGAYSIFYISHAFRSRPMADHRHRG